MVVVHIISPKFSDYIGGMETHALELAKHLSKEKELSLGNIFSKQVVTDGISAGKEVQYKGDGISLIDGFSVHTVLTGNFIIDAHYLAQFIEDGEVVFLNSPTWIPVLEELKKVKNVHCIVRSGGNDIPAGWIGNEDKRDCTLEVSQKRLVDLLNNFADVLICNSNYSKEVAVCLGVNENSIRVVSGGVDCDVFYPIKKEDKKITILTTGRFVQFKGIEEDLQAIALLKKSLGNNFYYRIVGDGPLRKRYLDLITELDVEDCVSVDGPVDINRIHEVYAEADIFLHLPYFENRTIGEDSYVHTETMGRTICEAMASGLPIVAAGVGGVPEMLSTQYPLLVKEKDVVGAAKFLKQLVENQQRREKLAQMNRQRAFDEFNWPILINKYKKIINTLMKNV